VLKEDEQVHPKWREQIERGWAQAQTGRLAEGAGVMADIERRLEERKRASRAWRHLNNS
jgi:predicted transcriptional regulator